MEKTTNKDNTETDNTKELLRFKAGVNVWRINRQIIEQASIPTGAQAVGILVS